MEEDKKREDFFKSEITIVDATIANEYKLDRPVYFARPPKRMRIAYSPWQDKMFTQLRKKYGCGKEQIRARMIRMGSLSYKEEYKVELERLDELNTDLNEHYDPIIMERILSPGKYLGATRVIDCDDNSPGIIGELSELLWIPSAYLTKLYCSLSLKEIRDTFWSSHIQNQIEADIKELGKYTKIRIAVLEAVVKIQRNG